MEGVTVLKLAEDPFFFPFAYHFFEATKIGLGCTKMEIATGKKHFSCREKIGKSDFAPLKNIPVTPL